MLSHLVWWLRGTNGCREYLDTGVLSSPVALYSETTEADTATDFVGTSENGILDFGGELVPLGLIECRTGREARDSASMERNPELAVRSEEWKTQRATLLSIELPGAADPCIQNELQLSGVKRIPRWKEEVAHRMRDTVGLTPKLSCDRVKIKARA
jgi:hypothetical protein